jgi:hypothetical protein
MSSKILIPASLDSYRSRNDGSLGLSFSTDIIKPDQLLTINALKNQTGILLFKDAGLTKDEEQIVDSIDIDLENKSPSQRFRGVLFRNWEQNNRGYEAFKDYYKFEMDRLIIHYKNKLD